MSDHTFVVRLTTDVQIEFNEATKQRLVEYYEDDWDGRGVANLALLMTDMYELSRIDGYADATEEGLECETYKQDEDWEVLSGD